MSVIAVRPTLTIPFSPFLTPYYSYKERTVTAPRDSLVLTPKPLKYLEKAISGGPPAEGLPKKGDVGARLPFLLSERSLLYWILCPSFQLNARMALVSIDPSNLVAILLAGILLRPRPTTANRWDFWWSTIPCFLIHGLLLLLLVFLLIKAFYDSHPHSELLRRILANEDNIVNIAVLLVAEGVLGWAVIQSFRGPSTPHDHRNPVHDDIELEALGTHDNVPRPGQPQDCRNAVRDDFELRALRRRDGVPQPGQPQDGNPGPTTGQERHDIELQAPRTHDGVPQLGQPPLELFARGQDRGTGLDGGLAIDAGGWPRNRRQFPPRHTQHLHNLIIRVFVAPIQQHPHRQSYSLLPARHRASSTLASSPSSHKPIPLCSKLPVLYLFVALHIILAQLHNSSSRHNSASLPTTSRSSSTTSAAGGPSPTPTPAVLVIRPRSLILNPYAQPLPLLQHQNVATICPCWISARAEERVVPVDSMFLSERCHGSGLVGFSSHEDGGLREDPPALPLVPGLSGLPVSSLVTIADGQETLLCAWVTRFHPSEPLSNISAHIILVTQRPVSLRNYIQKGNIHVTCRSDADSESRSCQPERPSAAPNDSGEKTYTLQPFCGHGREFGLAFNARGRSWTGRTHAIFTGYSPRCTPWNLKIMCRLQVFIRSTNFNVDLYRGARKGALTPLKRV
ncbi:hypothetical protein FA13DRAFT_1777315 [Coprinellus micaceus]|uniref:Uncharacterized protein n=1 Tax=Coprinellus micaceus TaxID=71717 RepID=A0A4Y7SVL6_COPMI|nr:hypothetical protein FA13DRAFT_1777315 [Coprinellus micaceus]